MKKTAVFAVLLLCTAAVLTAGCVGPAEPIDYPTALIGDWKSEGTYDAPGDVKFHMIYHFNEDNTGRDVAVQVRFRHDVLVEFLKQIGVSADTADKDACFMEHELHTETIQRIKEFVEKRK